jgi:hypothetical protein
MGRTTVNERRLAELDRERREVKRLMERDGLCSVMNDTKWRELCLAFHAMRPQPVYRTKDVLPRPIQPSLWDNEWYHSVGPYFVIEWMEIRPAVGVDLQPLVEVLRRVGTVFHCLDSAVRVYGYTRPSPQAHREATEA